MSDSSFDRTLSYRLSAAYDCWGSRRSLRRGSQHGIWFLDPVGLDEPAAEPAPAYSDGYRQRRLEEFRSSGQFTEIELATLEALVMEHLTIEEIAGRSGCSRQAVMARLIGNSRGQGGIVKKARQLLTKAALSE